MSRVDLINWFDFDESVKQNFNWKVLHIFYSQKLMRHVATFIFLITRGTHGRCMQWLMKP